MSIVKRPFRWLFAGGVAVALLGGLILIFAGPKGSTHGESLQNAKEKTAEKEHAPVAVTVAPVTIREIQRTVEAVGTFEGFEEVTISPKVDGRVVRILHEQDDVVRPGDVLLEIDPVDYELNVQEMQRSIESELAKSGLKEFPGPEFDINKLPTVVRAFNVAKNAASRLAIRKKLREQDERYVSKEEWDQAYFDTQVAEATVEQVKMDVMANVAKARQQAAMLETAKQRLKDTKVVVPIPTVAISKLAQSAQDVEYMIAERRISEGEMATRANPNGVFHLYIDKLMKFKAAVPEVFVSQVKVGQKVQLFVEAYPNKIFEGTLSRVGSKIDRESRTFQVEVLTPNPSRELRSGGFAKAKILTHMDPTAKTVPVEAVVASVGTTKVFVAKEGKAQILDVKTGISERNWVEITSAIDPKCQVITSGQNQLIDGTPIQIKTK